MKLKWANRAVLLGPYYVLCKTEREFSAAMKHLELPKDKRPDWISPGGDATTHFLTSPNGLCAVVCIGDCTGKSKAQINALLMHEGVHIWQSYKREIGETNPGDEIEAYAIQGYAQYLMEAYWEKKKK